MKVLRAMGKKYGYEHAKDFCDYGPQSLFWHN